MQLINRSVVRVLFAALLLSSTSCKVGLYTYSVYREIPAGSSLTVKSSRKAPVTLTVTNEVDGSTIKMVNGQEEKNLKGKEAASFTGNLKSQHARITNSSSVPSRVNIKVDNVTGWMKIRKE